MKAAYYSSFGPPEVVSIKDIRRPVPRKNEALVRVVASAVTAADSRIRGARFPKGFGFLARLIFGIRKPRNHVLGSCFSGKVAAVGSDVTNFKVGDEVCGMTGIKMGAHAEYVSVSANKSITLKPAKLSHEEVAGMLFGGTSALFFIRNRLQVSKGESVLIIGASGAVGTNAVQLAKYYGARVTAVTSGNNADLVRSIGADKVIDYTKQSLDDSGTTYDAVLDSVGSLNVKSGLKLLKPGGRLALMVANLPTILSTAANKRVLTGTATEKKEDIEFLLQLMTQKQLVAVIDSTYNLSDIITAHARVDSGQKKGNVILRTGKS